MAVRGVALAARNARFVADHGWLSLNTATVRRQARLPGRSSRPAPGTAFPRSAPGATRSRPSGCERGRDRHRGTPASKLSGYCRGGMFPASGEPPCQPPLRRQPPRRRRGRGTGLRPASSLVAGGLPQYSRPGSRPQGHRRRAEQVIEDGIAELLAHAQAANMPLAHGTAASDVCRRPRLREHTGPGAGHLRPARPRRPARWASPSTSITSGGIRTCRPQIGRAGATSAAARLSRLRLAGADQGHAATTAA